MSLTTVIGTLPVGSSRRWRDYLNFIDITGNSSDLHKLKLTWTTDRNDSGLPTPGETNQKKSASGSVSIEGEAFRLIKAWLLDDVSSPLNSVEVKIEDTDCGIYEGYQLKSTDLRWCQTDVCQFDVVFKQRDQPLTCLKRTVINDNWNGWFPDTTQVPVDLTSGNLKYHPRFSYCNEERPNAKLVVKFFNMSVLCVFLITFIAPFAIAYNSIVFIIATIVNTINFIINFINSIGASINTINFNANFITFGDLKDSFARMFVEAAGCGREHPAPLVRDYIKNVCDKCGIKVDGTTAPIFFADHFDIQTSDRDRGNSGVIATANPHYNAAYLSPLFKRGIRRFGNFGIGQLFGNSNPNNTSFWIPENAPNKPLDIFLDELGTVYNTEWNVKGFYENGAFVHKLYIQRKDYFKNKPGTYIYDFTGADKSKIIEGICYEWTGKKLPAFIDGIYTKDAADTCGNEAAGQQNGMVSIGNIDDNPNLSGKLDKTSPYFGAAKFRLDGISTDYIFDAMQVVANSQILTGFMAGFVKDFIYPDIRDYADYALLMRDETCTLPKILLWDKESGYLNAKAIKQYKYIAGQDPVINSKYNNLPFRNKHAPETFVIGSSLTLVSSPYGVYKVQDFFGLRLAEAAAMLVNYPMYFEPGYYDTLWDWFHWIDDPMLNPILNQTGTVKIPLCCEDLLKLKPFYDAAQIVLGEKIKIDLPFQQDGRIREITVSYDPSDTLGSYIEIKFDV